MVLARLYSVGAVAWYNINMYVLTASWLVWSGSLLAQCMDGKVCTRANDALMP
jgi:hypothetical protein